MRIFKRCKCRVQRPDAKKTWYCFEHKQWWRVKIKLFRGQIWVRCSRRKAQAVRDEEVYSHRLIK